MPKIRWSEDIIDGRLHAMDAFIGSIRNPVGCVVCLFPEKKFRARTRLPGGYPFKEQDSMAMAQEDFENYLDKWFEKAKENIQP